MKSHSYWKITNALVWAASLNPMKLFKWKWIYISWVWITISRNHFRLGKVWPSVMLSGFVSISNLFLAILLQNSNFKIFCHYRTYLVTSDKQISRSRKNFEKGTIISAYEASLACLLFWHYCWLSTVPLGTSSWRAVLWCFDLMPPFSKGLILPVCSKAQIFPSFSASNKKLDYFMLQAIRWKTFLPSLFLGSH